MPQKLVALCPSKPDVDLLQKDLQDFFNKRKEYSLTSLEKTFEAKRAFKSGKSELTEAIEYCLANSANLIILKRFRKKGFLETLLELRKLVVNGLEFFSIYDCEIKAEELNKLINAEKASRKKKAPTLTLSTIVDKATGKKLGNPNFHNIRNDDTSAATQAKMELADTRAKKLMLEIEKLPPSDQRSYRTIAKALEKKNIRIDGYKSINAMTISRAYKRLKKITDKKVQVHDIYFFT